MKNLFLIILSIFIFFNESFASSSPKKNESNTSIIDISNNSLQNGEIVKLDGKWEFYWDQILTPIDFKSGKNPKLDGYFPVPLYWTEYKKFSFPSEGKATYRILIKSNEINKTLSIITPEIFSEYSLFINGKLKDSHGSFIDKEARFLKPRVFTFYNKSKIIEILINIKNHHHNNAGIGQSFYIGSSESINSKYLKDRVMEMILVAICIFAGIYHIILFSFRKKEKELLYFGLFSLIIALRTILTGTSFIMEIFPELPFSIGSRAATMIIPLSVMSFQLYVCHFFSKFVPRKIHYTLISLHSIYIFLILVTPTIIYSTIYTEYLLIIMSSCIFILSLSIHAFKNKSKYSGIFICGFLFFFIGIINDTLHYLQIINTGYYLSFFFSLFIIAQSIMLAIKFSNEHTMVENLSNKLQVLDKLKDEFLANTSHELKTPLNGIIGLSDSLIDGITGSLPEKTIFNLQLISSSGRRLSSLINDILDFSKLKNNDISISEKNIDLKQMVSVVLTIIKTTSHIKNIELINTIDDNFPPVRGDENRLQQILFNLIGNAIKFTERGHVKIGASEKQNEITVTIQDTGMGIPLKSINDIFKSFEQADGGISRDYGGTGLGLPITKKLIELQGGKIWVESKLKEGTIFSFTLKKGSNDNEKCNSEIIALTDPVIENSELNESFPNHDVPNKDEILKNKNERILIVDDETVNLQVLENYLSMEGYKTVSASNGQEALDIIEKESFDLILLDIMMPKMSGYEVCTKIRESQTAYKLPVLMLTARNISSDIATVFHSGANDYLIKPIDRQELIARIKTHISLSYAVDDAIKNAHLANTDELTGLYNRRFLIRSGNREFKNCRIQNKSMSLLMIDIDKFKSINDNYGHSSGDLIIQDISKIIQNNTRGVDIPARYGGEEFTIILPGTDMKGAKIVAEKIRKHIESSTVFTEDNIALHYTASLGISTCLDQFSKFDELLFESDKMLYKSKNEGRNRVSSPEI